MLAARDGCCYDHFGLSSRRHLARVARGRSSSAPAVRRIGLDPGWTYDRKLVAISTCAVTGRRTYVIIARHVDVGLGSRHQAHEIVLAHLDSVRLCQHALLGARCTCGRCSDQFYVPILLSMGEDMSLFGFVLMHIRASASCALVLLAVHCSTNIRLGVHLTNRTSSN